MARFFRIVKAAWADTAMNGEGARINGGRWNPPGIPVVYLADSRALATLEILVHLGRKAVSLDWRIITAEVPDGMLELTTSASMPVGWDALPSSLISRKIGADWARQGKKPAILLPSAVIPTENTLLLNVRHPEFQSLKFSKPERFLFDRRLG